MSGTLTFTAGDTRKTISVPITDDTEVDGGETFTLTLGNASGAALGDAEATGTIRNTEAAAPLTASFSDMPASHTGEEFTFGLAFSEEVDVGYVTLRDTAFVVAGGEVSQAQRQQQGSNQAWNITVDPDGQGAVTITLPETTDCDAVGRDLYRGRATAVALAVERGRGTGDHSDGGRVRRERGRGRCGPLHGVAVGGEQPAGDGRVRDIGRHGDERGPTSRRRREH